MKVRELKDRLSKMSDDLEVYYDSTDGYEGIGSVEKVMAWVGDEPVMLVILSE